MSQGEKKEKLSEEAEELLQKSRNKKPETGLEEPKENQSVEEAVEEKIKERTGKED